MMTQYANCDVMSGQDRKFKLKYLIYLLSFVEKKYLINKALERRRIKELVLQFSFRRNFNKRRYYKK